MSVCKLCSSAARSRPNSNKCSTLDQTAKINRSNKSRKAARAAKQQRTNELSRVKNKKQKPRQTPKQKNDGTHEPECKHVLENKRPNNFWHSCSKHSCGILLYVTCGAVLYDTHSCVTPLRNTLVGHYGTLLRDTLVRHSCRTDTLVKHSCGALVGHSCPKILWGTLAEHSCRTLL